MRREGQSFFFFPPFLPWRQLKKLFSGEGARIALRHDTCTFYFPPAIYLRSGSVIWIFLFLPPPLLGFLPFFSHPRSGAERCRRSLMVMPCFLLLRIPLHLRCCSCSPFFDCRFLFFWHVLLRRGKREGYRRFFSFPLSGGFPLRKNNGRSMRNR